MKPAMYGAAGGAIRWQPQTNDGLRKWEEWWSDGACTGTYWAKEPKAGLHKPKLHRWYATALLVGFMRERRSKNRKWVEL